MATIQNEIVKTKQIKNACKKFVAEHLIAPSECDFQLNKVETLIKSLQSEGFELYNKERLQSFLNKQKILNEHVSFMQKYTITMMHTPKKELELLYDIEFGKYATHPKLILSPDSKIPYAKYKPVELLNLLYRELNKTKAYHGILVQIFDEPMKKALKILVKYIYAKKFLKKVAIPLFDGIEPVIARDSKLILWFLQKEKNDAMVIEVEQDELLVEYKKPIFGKNGLNAYGEYISNEITLSINDLQAKVDSNSVYIEEDEYTKKYKAKHKGYVYYDKKTLAVDTKLRLQAVSRNTNVLESDQEKNNIEVVIKQHDVTKDSIGEGVSLVSENIHVDGFVGAGSLLEATHLEIEGATHQDSKQFAKFAKINRHKGKLRCHEANVKLLEGGTIHATKATVEGALGGEIHAQDVIVGQVKNHLKVYASNSITIRLVSGEDNIFEINYKKVSVLLAKIEFIEKEIDDLRYKRQQAERFQPEELPAIQHKIQQKKEEIRAITESYKNASISVEKPFRGLNHIIFTIDENHQLHYKTDARKYETFHLEIKDDLLILQPPAISLSLS